MKIKVTNILSVGTPYNGTNKKTGKPYTISSWFINGEVDGVTEENLTLKSFKQVSPEVGKEYEVKEEDYNGKISYTIQEIKQQQTGSFQKSGYSKPVYSLEEYDALFDHAIFKVQSKLSIIDSTNVALVSTYIISAVNSSVKVPITTQSEKVKTAQSTEKEQKNVPQSSKQENKQDLSDEKTEVYNIALKSLTEMKEEGFITDQDIQASVKLIAKNSTAKLKDLDIGNIQIVVERMQKLAASKNLWENTGENQ
jgi:hypothetical protein